MRKTFIVLGFATVVGTVSAETLPIFSNWTGFYVGGNAGWTHLIANSNRILFDTGLNGEYGDTVNTILGDNIFASRSCNGQAFGLLASARCNQNNDNSADVGVRVGYDWQINNIIVGTVGEYTAFNAHENISAFSTSPAFYMLTREIKHAVSIRGRIGLPFEEFNHWLAYVTAGGTWVNIKNTFATSNTTNIFMESNKNKNVGSLQGGLGVERYLNNHVALGLEYLYARLKNGDYRVRAARGDASAINPFNLVNANGTDFARQKDAINLGSLRFTLTWHV